MTNGAPGEGASPENKKELHEHHHHHDPLRATSLDVEELRALVARKGLRLESSWYWQGRARQGILRLLDGSDTPVHASLYRRVTQVWTAGDAQLLKVRTGSPRHLAILETLDFIKRAG